MAGERVQGRVFGEVAAEYDRIRPGYPRALVDAVLVHTAAPGPALEVGAGTGKATVAFAERGLTITAIEPDPAMAEMLARRCARYPGVSVAVSAFEDHVPARPYGLVFSAQAWHWIDPLRRCRLAAEALAPRGSLALFWNFDRILDRRVQDEVLAAYRALVPDLVWDTEAADEGGLLEAWPGPELVACDHLTDVQARLFRSGRILTRADYLAFLSTHSSIRMLEPSARAQLLDALAPPLPDVVRLDVDTVLYLARRA